MDAFDGDPKTRASFNDWVNQVGKDDYGFGTAFPMTGWGGRIIGLAGDVLLDPLTWLRPFGAGAGKLAKLADGTPLKTAIGRTSVANQSGRLALADYAIRLGRSPEEVAQYRLEICKGCDFFRKTTQTCKKCGCFMAAKSMLANAKCPIGKW